MPAGTPNMGKIVPRRARASRTAKRVQRPLNGADSRFYLPAHAAERCGADRKPRGTSLVAWPAGVWIHTHALYAETISYSSSRRDRRRACGAGWLRAVARPGPAGPFRSLRCHERSDINGVARARRHERRDHIRRFGAYGAGCREAPSRRHRPSWLGRGSAESHLTPPFHRSSAAYVRREGGGARWPV